MTRWASASKSGISASNLPKDPSGLTSCQSRIRKGYKYLPQSNSKLVVVDSKLECSCRPQVRHCAVLSLVDLDVTLRQSNHLWQNRRNLQLSKQEPQMTHACMFPAEASSSQIMDLEPLRCGLVKHLSSAEVLRFLKLETSRLKLGMPALCTFLAPACHHDKRSQPSPGISDSMEEGGSRR